MCHSRVVSRRQESRVVSRRFVCVCHGTFLLLLWSLRACSCDQLVLNFGMLLALGLGP